MLTYDQPRKQVYVAMDLGAFYLKNRNKNWARIGDGLPDAPILALRLSGDDQAL